MARKSVPLPQEDLELTPSEEFVPALLDDARLVDLETEEESPFLRAQKRVSVRRGSIPKKTASRLRLAAIAFAVLTVVGLIAVFSYRYGMHSWRFTIESSDDIEITGNHNVPRAQLMEVLGGDIGRNLFFVPLAERQQQLEQIPWVGSATVMRFLPNRLKVEIQERKPVAFARIGSRIALIDANGVVMELPPTSHAKYSFPVLVGMGESEPLSTRAARMKIYSDVIRQLDAGGANYSQDLSEVDLSDTDDVKVTVNDPSGTVLVHLGSTNYLNRYKIYVAHVGDWRQQFQKLQSVDLRYDRQIIVNPDSRLSHDKPLSAPAVRAALAAGVKPAALTASDLKRGAMGVGAASKWNAKSSTAKTPVSKTKYAKSTAPKKHGARRAGRHHRRKAHVVAGQD